MLSLFSSRATGYQSGSFPSRVEVLGDRVMMCGWLQCEPKMAGNPHRALSRASRESPTPQVYRVALPAGRFSQCRHSPTRIRTDQREPLHPVAARPSRRADPPVRLAVVHRADHDHRDGRGGAAHRLRPRMPHLAHVHARLARHDPRDGHPRHDRVRQPADDRRRRHHRARAVRARVAHPRRAPRPLHARLHRRRRHRRAGDRRRHHGLDRAQPVHRRLPLRLVAAPGVRVRGVPRAHGRAARARASAPSPAGTPASPTPRPPCSRSRSCSACSRPARARTRATPTPAATASTPSCSSTCTRGPATPCSRSRSCSSSRRGACGSRRSAALVAAARRRARADRRRPLPGAQRAPAARGRRAHGARRAHGRRR